MRDPRGNLLLAVNDLPDGWRVRSGEATRPGSGELLSYTDREVILEAPGAPALRTLAGWHRVTLKDGTTFVVYANRRTVYGAARAAEIETTAIVRVRR